MILETEKGEDAKPMAKSWSNQEMIVDHDLSLRSRFSSRKRFSYIIQALFYRPCRESVLAIHLHCVVQSRPR